MAVQHSQTADFETRYKFNDYGGKKIKYLFVERIQRSCELDQETGLYYYGARYYNPQTSIWLSVDLLVEKYPGINPYVYTYNNPIRFIDAFGMEGEDWYKNKKTGEVEWFEGNLDIKGYKHLNYDYVETVTDADNNTTIIKYDGDTKSSYKYNIETGKFVFLKNYDNSNMLEDGFSKIANPVLHFTDQFTTALIDGFQTAGIAMYEVIVNGEEADGLDVAKLGYKPALNINRTYEYNNGEWIVVDLHSKGKEHYANTQLKDTYKTLSKINWLSYPEKIKKIPEAVKNFLENYKKIF